MVGAKDGMPLERAHIYLTPPRTLLAVQGGQFCLSARNESNLGRLTVNHLFQSLANEYGAQAVGIVLSGGGSDGADGARQIRSKGGLVLVQEPDTAEHDSMPRNARPFAHRILQPAEMPRVLSELELPSKSAENYDQEIVGPITDLLRHRFGLDFSHYRIGTVARRISRRMAMLKIANQAEYANILVQEPEELDALYCDLLIGVTQFFRDPAVYEFLADKVIPKLLQKKRGREIRIWVPGCATGQEVYSLAILFREIAEQTGLEAQTSFFATDVHTGALQKAADGLYPEQELGGLSPDRLDRFFVPEGEGYRVRPEIRKSVVFTRHNLLSDPPFAKLDLISCRNVFIYLQSSAQERALRAFRFALRAEGLLVLGPSEGVGRTENTAFEVWNNSLRIFKRREGTLPARLDEIPRPLTFGRSASGNPGVTRRLLAAYDQLLETHLPDGVLLNDTLEIQHYFGNAARFLSPPSGRAKASILNALGGDLRLALSIQLPRVFKTGAATSARGVRLNSHEVVDLQLEPIFDGDSIPFVFLSFAQTRPIAPVPAEQEQFEPMDALRRRIVDLEAELQNARDQLRTAVEEISISYEELQTTNEELSLANEELQSTNEELHSVNEELYTVNTEFERKNQELQHLNDDLNNLLKSTEVGTVLVDHDLKIRKFNPAIGDFFSLLESDIGRPLDNISYSLGADDSLVKDLQRVLQDGVTLEHEVRTAEGRWLLQRSLPFIDSQGQVEGVLVTFTDVTPIKSLQERLGLALSVAPLSWWEWYPAEDRLELHGNTLPLGYPPDELPARASFWRDQIHPDDRSVLRSLEKASDVRTEVRIRRRDGSWIWTFLTARVTDWDADGAPREVIGTASDRSERRLVEDTLRRQADILDQLHDAVVCMDREGIVLYWNQGSTRLHGWTAEEMVGRHAADRFPSTERAEVKRMVDGILSGELTGGELVDRSKEGRQFWVEFRAAPLLDSRGDKIGVVSISRDITERREAETVMRRDADILSQLAEAVVCSDLNGIITYWNRSAEEMFGFTSQEMIGRPHLGRFPPDLRSELVEKRTQVLEQRTVQPLEIQDVRRDGSRFWVLWRLGCLYDSNGEVCGTIDVGSDIDARYRIAEERREMELQLLQAQKMETIGRLVSGIAHDFNNLLTAINGCTELALNFLEEGESPKECLEDVSLAGRRAAELVKRLLTFSRRKEPEKRLIDLAEVAREAGHLVRSVLPGTVHLKIEITEAKLHAMADSTQVQQVYLNLASNAADAMANCGRLEIRLKAVDVGGAPLFSGELPPGRYALLTVVDQGYGIQPEHLERIFDPFFTTKRVGEGTGLGLSIVHSIVTGYGGGINIITGPEKGTTFQVYFPLVEGVPEAAPQTSSTTLFKGNGEHLLLLDDDPAVASFTQRALTRLGYRVTLFHDPEDLLEFLLEKERSCDLIVTDLIMPGMTGADVLRRLRQAGREEPVLVYSGSHVEMEQSLPQDRHNLARLIKPFQLEELAQKAHTLLHRPNEGR